MIAATKGIAVIAEMKAAAMKADIVAARKRRADRSAAVVAVLRPLDPEALPESELQRKWKR
jgi:hypothetical protein